MDMVNPSFNQLSSAWWEWSGACRIWQTVRTVTGYWVEAGSPITIGTLGTDASEKDRSCTCTGPSQSLHSAFEHGDLLEKERPAQSQFGNNGLGYDNALFHVKLAFKHLQHHT